MSFNRFDAESAALVTSLNQWVPLLLEFDADEPLDSMVKKVHWKAFNAFKNGTCDPDAIVAIRTEFEALDPPIDPGFNFNAILAPPGFPAPEEPPAPPRFEWYDLDRTSGPGFYLIARAISSISIVCRIRWPAMTKPILEDFLMSMRDTLVEAVGLEQLSAAATTPPG
jgi:hypothetical protein